MMEILNPRSYAGCTQAPRSSMLIVHFMNNIYLSNLAPFPLQAPHGVPASMSYLPAQIGTGGPDLGNYKTCMK